MAFSDVRTCFITRAAGTSHINTPKSIKYPPTANEICIKINIVLRFVFMFGDVSLIHWIAVSDHNFFFVLFISFVYLLVGGGGDGGGDGGHELSKNKNQ